MGDTSKQLKGLRPIPVRIAAAWEEKTVTTDPPRYIPHTEYTLSFRIQCDVLLLPVLMLVDEGKGQFSKPWRSSARREWEFRLSLFPCNWQSSSKVQINFEGLDTIVENADLKGDPRPFVTTPCLGDEQIIVAGSVLTMAAISAGREIEARLLLAAKDDTLAKRGRWSLKPMATADLPAELRFLASGRTAGTL